MAVNAVQVLSDTMHAVSCGDDGLCWVWKICSGTPRQVFFPNRDCPTDTPFYPMYTVSVLNDATFILSGGAADANGTTGMAYIWDWRYGFQKSSYTCYNDDLAAGGVAKSSAEMPAWRQVVVGCSSGYSTVWDWDTGAKVNVPYCKKSVEEILAEFNGKMTQYRDYHLDGMQRLFAERAMITEMVFIDVVKKVNPKLVKDMKFMAHVWNFFHKNRFGSTNAIAYVPTNIRFVTGQANGKVLFFDGETGQILMAMTGHQGQVYAVAASPKKMQALSGGEDGTVRLWCLKTGIQLSLFYQPYGGPIRSLAVIPGGNKVVVGSTDGYVRIWDINTGILLCAINTGGGPVLGLAVNPSNPLGQIITANKDGYARVFNPR
jgi:WD40 repeat protein